MPDHHHHFLKLLMLAVAAAAVHQQTVVEDVEVVDADFSKEVDSFCTCRKMCFVQPACAAVSYERDSAMCKISTKPPQSVSSGPKEGAVTVFSYPVEEKMFTTRARTYDPSPHIQRSMCAAENGSPPSIKTQQQRHQAMQALEAGGASSAFTSAQGSGNKDLFWPDGSPVSRDVFGEFRTLPSGGEASILRSDGVLYISNKDSIFSWQVLCFKYGPAL